MLAFGKQSFFRPMNPDCTEECNWRAQILLAAWPWLWAMEGGTSRVLFKTSVPQHLPASQHPSVTCALMLILGKDASCWGISESWRKGIIWKSSPGLFRVNIKYAPSFHFPVLDCKWWGTGRVRKGTLILKDRYFFDSSSLHSPSWT